MKEPWKNCEICKNIPEEVKEDTQRPGNGPEIPIEVDKLAMVAERYQEKEYLIHAKLLKCPKCKTYYMYNHYKDDEDAFVGGMVEKLELVRSDEPTAKRFLDEARNTVEPSRTLKQELEQVERNEDKPWKGCKICSKLPNKVDGEVRADSVFKEPSWSISDSIIVPKHRTEIIFNAPLEKNLLPKHLNEEEKPEYLAIWKCKKCGTHYSRVSYDISHLTGSDYEYVKFNRIRTAYELNNLLERLRKNIVECKICSKILEKSSRVTNYSFMCKPDVNNNIPKEKDRLVRVCGKDYPDGSFLHVLKCPECGLYYKDESEYVGEGGGDGTQTTELKKITNEEAEKLLELPFMRPDYEQLKKDAMLLPRKETVPTLAKLLFIDDMDIGWKVCDTLQRFIKHEKPKKEDVRLIIDEIEKNQGKRNGYVKDVLKRAKKYLLNR